MDGLVICIYVFILCALFFVDGCAYRVELICIYLLVSTVLYLLQ